MWKTLPTGMKAHFRQKIKEKGRRQRESNGEKEGEEEEDKGND